MKLLSTLGRHNRLSYSCPYLFKLYTRSKISVGSNSDPISYTSLLYLSKRSLVILDNVETISTVHPYDTRPFGPSLPGRHLRQTVLEPLFEDLALMKSFRYSRLEPRVRVDSNVCRQEISW